MKTILETVRKNVPLVHFITNYVTVNDGTSYGSIGEYGCKEAHLANNPISVTTLIGVNDNIYLPEVLI